ncbi:CRP/FNR family transcriptional regulator, anaerobic regulatory protein [Aliiroseovarius halocynthiae]|uniref:Crp/Fnr family transcriptional regulator n=1 Tax=Aliiroseovarius halocynthiae TaxID=985055 RepID=A0A545SRQ0_9RHOB|nr:Crp/Fnr family transcriptional regulator [Aliiroseovarius halocynthiae]TQV67627.1 Crp/Fnr family transcriptional regulator [Aliiroseovarius halocynthiae]SMR81660.1 CRP/FNR family transcriptional regulator, anaerobic regulatory protein [Aliiroseovarius halocynthiae]
MNDTSFNPRDCGTCPIRHRAVCSRCEPEELDHLDDIKYYRTYEAGQPVIWAGDPMEFVASVVTGIATLSQTMEDGRTQMVGLLLPSDFIGRPGREHAPFDVVAVTDLTLCCFRKKPFESLMGSTPSIGGRLLQMTLDELDSAREWMLVLGRKTAREKIASLLLIIARRDAALHKRLPKDGMSFDLPLTREAMADYLGLTLETVSRQISALKKSEVINLQGKRQVHIPDLQKLIGETGDDVDGGHIF